MEQEITEEDIEFLRDLEDTLSREDIWLRRKK
jgi:hypothetical protein